MYQPNLQHMLAKSTMPRTVQDYNAALASAGSFLQEIEKAHANPLPGDPSHILEVPTPVAFNAVVSIGVIGLYWCFAIPIWHRWRLGNKFKQGNWNLGTKYKWLAVIALIDVLLVSFMSFMPTSNLGVPWTDGFALKYVNYTINVVPVAMIALWIYWHASVKKWFTGPRQTIDMTDEELAKGI